MSIPADLLRAQQEANKRHRSTPPPTSAGGVFAALCRAQLGHVPQAEYAFHPSRRWRFDYAFPTHQIALEVEGGVWSNGRHTRGKGFLGDVEKYNAAAVAGWLVLRCVPNTLCSTATLDLLHAAITYRTSQL